MFNIKGLVVILTLLLIGLLVRHMMLKKQVRNLTGQISELSSGKTEKILDISLIDRDMEKLAGKFKGNVVHQIYVGLVMEF